MLRQFHRIVKIYFMRIDGIKKGPAKLQTLLMSGYSDSNGGPSAPKADGLANCATPQLFLRTTPEKGTAKLNSNIQFANFFNKCEGKRRRRCTTEVQKRPFFPRGRTPLLNI